MLFLNKFISYTLFFLLLMSFMPESLTSQNDLHDYEIIRTTRLVTDADHKNFLINTLNSAKKSVMISSYDVSPKIFYNENIGKSIINAAERGVNIYIYFEHDSCYSTEDYKKLQNLQKICAKFETNCNHSKCVLKDDDTVAIGSYNWLSCFNETSSNATIVTIGAIALELREDVWQGMRFYQSLEYGNTQGISNFCLDEDVFQPKVYGLGDHGQIEILRTPEAHHVFINQLFNNALNNIVMFSPFVRLQNLQKNFTPKMLSRLNNRKINTTLVMLPEPCKNPEEQGKIFAILNEMQRVYPCFAYKTQNDFHAKTLVSDNMICEGSFNWLSAVTETSHDANNYEVSIAIKGNFALESLESFHESALGRIIAPLKAINRKISITPSIPADFNKHIKIYSGAKYNKQGFCVKLDGDYIIEGKNAIVYLETEEDARQAAYGVWVKANPQTQKNLNQSNLKRELPQIPIQSNKKPKVEPIETANIPKYFDQHINIYSGANYNKHGFCVKLDGQYIVDETNSIIYFENRDLARQVAYDVWSTANSNRSFRY